MRYLLILVLALCFAACSKEDSNTSRRDLPFESIELRKTCGWCADGEVLTITDHEMLDYAVFSSCDFDDISEEKTRDLTEIGFNRLLVVFDFEKFKTVDFNQCGTCRDACDDKLTITSADGQVHSIRFSNPNSPELEEIRDLIDELLSTRDSF